ncbi:MAG: SDR family oxidoreductase [Isosphaeraceae bacterium]
MRVVLTGASGQLGRYVAERLARTEWSVARWWGRRAEQPAGDGMQTVDLQDHRAVVSALEAFDPAAVIHLGAISAVEEARRDPERARAVNVEATRTVAQWCSARGRKLVFTSTDLVFDGRLPRRYREDDPPSPETTYGRTKVDAEAAALAAPGGIVARLSLLYGPAKPGGVATYLDRAMTAFHQGETQAFFEDEFRTPLDLETAAEILVRLAESDRSGLVHVGGAERVSRYELAQRIASALCLDSRLLQRNRQCEQTFAEPRPADVALDTTRLVEWLPDLRRPTIEESAVRLWDRTITNRRDGE